MVKICEKVSATDLWELSPLQSILHTSPPLVCQHNLTDLIWFDLVWSTIQLLCQHQHPPYHNHPQRHSMQHSSWLWCRQSLKICQRPSSWSDVAEIVDDTSLGKPQKLDDLGNWETSYEWNLASSQSSPLKSMLKSEKRHLVIEKHVRNVAASVGVPNLMCTFCYSVIKSTQSITDTVKSKHKVSSVPTRFSAESNW